MVTFSIAASRWALVMLEWMQTAFRHGGSPDTSKRSRVGHRQLWSHRFSCRWQGLGWENWYLVIHEGHQGGDHQGDALGALVIEVSRELVAEGLAHPCR